MPPAIPDAQDVPWPGGPMRLDVDATDIARRIISVRQTIPLPPGGAPLVLRLPEWLPGAHGPRGEIDHLAGLGFTVDGKPVAWLRDAVDVYAFHIDLPPGATTLVAQFQYLAATDPDQGRVKITDTVLNIEWENVSLYPAGYYVRRVPVQANVTYPDGWRDASALRGTRTGATVAYAETDYETLIDSPVFAGRHARSWDLGRGVRLNVVADSDDELAATDGQIATHRKLVDEAVALFGARSFDRYDFLLAISRDFGRVGLEHHRSSENSVKPGYFTEWNSGPGERNILPHELAHSWDGKYRRPADLWTPDYATPMRDGLLWVYEGQTQFWGYVLGARSGIYTKDQTLDALATIAARLDETKGRLWRPLADTTYDPIVSGRRPKPWADWARNEDYYNEGLMIWLEADAIIRQGTKGRKGLDDFAGRFFRPRDGDWGSVTYDRADVVAALNAVYPHDWNHFLAERIDRIQPQVTKAGLEMGGYRLDWTDKPGDAIAARERESRLIDQTHGIGLVVRDDGSILKAAWGSPAFEAALTDADRIIAVDGTEFDRERFRALLAMKSRAAPLQLLVKRGRTYRTVPLNWTGGLRYPRLIRTGAGQGSLDRLLEPRT